MNKVKNSRFIRIDKNIHTISSIKKATYVALVAGDITYRLNVNSVTRVYSIQMYLHKYYISHFQNLQHFLLFFIFLHHFSSLKTRISFKQPLSINFITKKGRVAALPFPLTTTRHIYYMYFRVG